MGKGGPGKPKTEEHNRKVSEALRGRKLSAEHIAKLRKPKSEEHRAALRLAQTSEVVAKRHATHSLRHGCRTYLANPINNKYCLEYWVAKGYSEDVAKVCITEIQKKNSKLRKSTVSIWQTKFWVQQGYTEDAAKLKVSALQATNGSKSARVVSKSGKALLDELEKLTGLSFEREVLLESRFRVDGFNSEHGIVVEYFGTFWHMHPSVFAADDINRVTGWKAQSKWNEDAGRIKYLQAAGYKVFVVWEHQTSLEQVQQIAVEITNACSFG
jgi:G:T-mismatch repair DNA endonuclease (very short patch repair protein)